MKQRKRIQILLLVALSGLSTIGYAQNKVCFGTPYEIKELVPPSDPSIFQWIENGQEIPGANAATYTIPDNQPVGRYTYLRNSLKAGCDWASSNAYWVEVINCGTITSSDPVSTKGSFQDPRDNKVYKVVKMPDEKVWFAENLNYQKDLTFNQRADVANGVPFTSTDNGTPAIGSFWCPALANAVISANKNTCSVYGALYTWETAMMVDGKWADETQMSSEWDELWVSGNYYTTGAPGTTPVANVNNARGGGRGICPPGWHIPTELEWAQLLDKVEGDGNSATFTPQENPGYWGVDAGIKLKSVSISTTVSFDTPGWVNLIVAAGTDEYGFCALPSGVRLQGGTFAWLGSSFMPWGSSVFSSGTAWRHIVNNDNDGVNRSSMVRARATLVRCMQD
jgi:uncharacterized protein (TIGR02145 family)